MLLGPCGHARTLFPRSSASVSQLVVLLDLEALNIALDGMFTASIKGEAAQGAIHTAVMAGPSLRAHGQRQPVMEVDAKVRPARAELIRRAVCIKGWMIEING